MTALRVSVLRLSFHTQIWKAYEGAYLAAIVPPGNDRFQYFAEVANKTFQADLVCSPFEAFSCNYY